MLQLHFLRFFLIRVMGVNVRHHEARTRVQFLFMPLIGCLLRGFVPRLDVTLNTRAISVPNNLCAVLVKILKQWTGNLAAYDVILITGSSSFGNGCLEATQSATADCTAQGRKILQQKGCEGRLCWRRQFWQHLIISLFYSLATD